MIEIEQTTNIFALMLARVLGACKTLIASGVLPGSADLARVVKILKDANYRGYLHLEYEGTEDPLVAVPRALKRLKELV